MGRKKLVRFVDNITSENVIQEGKSLFNDIKGNWNKLYFKNNNPIVLELACGYGEYTVGLAKINPDKNYIGIDIKGERIAVGSAIATSCNLKNVAFLRINIHFLLNFFEKHEVSEIWLTFPDPYSIRASPARRLTHSKYLELFRSILHPNHRFYFKSDSKDLFEFSVGSILDFGVREIFATDDYYTSSLYDDVKNFKTRFEEIFTDRGYSIKFIECVFKK